MPVDGDDRRLDNIGMQGDERALDNTNPSKRCRTHLMIPAQAVPLQGADEDEAMGLHIFDSRDMMEGTQDIHTWDIDRAAEDTEETRYGRHPGTSTSTTELHPLSAGAITAGTSRNSRRHPKTKKSKGWTSHAGDHRKNCKGQGWQG